MTITSLLEELPTTNLINTTKECVDQMTQDIATLQDTYMQISTKLWEVMKGPKDDIGGSRLSHK